MILPPAFTAREDEIHAVIETPRGSHNTYVYEPEHDWFRLKKVLSPGTAFPLDFGFVPRTQASDGDPLDVLVILDSPAVVGAVLECIGSRKTALRLIRQQTV